MNPSHCPSISLLFPTQRHMVRHQIIIRNDNDAFPHTNISIYYIARFLRYSSSQRTSRRFSSQSITLFHNDGTNGITRELKPATAVLGCCSTFLEPGQLNNNSYYAWPVRIVLLVSGSSVTLRPNFNLHYSSSASRLEPLLS